MASPELQTLLLSTVSPLQIDGAKFQQWGRPVDLL